MIELLQRVSPSQTELPQGDPKRLKGSEESKAGLDFKHQLEKQIKKEEPKDKNDSKDLKAQIDKPSRGIKKKMVKTEKDNDEPKEDEDKELKNNAVAESVVSKSMASKENENETADFDKSLQIAENQAVDKTENRVEVQAKATEPASGEFLPDEQELQALDDLAEQSSVHASESTLSPALVSEAQPTQQDTAKPVTDFQNKVSEALGKESTDFSLQKNIQIDKSNFQEGDSELMQAETKDQKSSEVAAKDKSVISEQGLNLQKTAEHHKENTSQFESQDKSDKEAQFNSMHVGQSSSSGHSFATALKMEAASTTQETVAAGENNPIKDIMNQAQFLVKKGGGEMTVKLDATHGLGDVQLKVLMTNGVVNIEMNTNDKSVKKLIEESLSDLKSSLASQHLSLEHVKINNVIATNTENQTQFSSQGQNADSQNSFYDQMNQRMNQQSQQQSSRRSQILAEGPSLNLSRPTEIPLTAVKTSAASRYYGLNKGTSLNAVA